MGPRSCDRGESTSLDPEDLTLGLQWGRGHVTAESKKPRRGGIRRGLLQWGRGHVTAESTPSIAISKIPDASGFNGAAVM